MTITAAPVAADTLTPDEVHDVKFTPVRFRREGYDQTEVDNFLDRVENQLRTNEEYADGLLKLLQVNGIMAQSREEAAEPADITPAAIPAISETPAPARPVVVTAVPTPVSDPANISLPEAA